MQNNCKYTLIHNLKHDNFSTSKIMIFQRHSSLSKQAQCSVNIKCNMQLIHCFLHSPRYLQYFNGF